MPIWQSQEMYDLKEKAFLHKKVKNIVKLYGNAASAYSESITNLTLIPIGSIGTVVEYDESLQVPADFVKVRFHDGLFVNASLTTLVILDKVDTTNEVQP